MRITAIIRGDLTRFFGPEKLLQLARSPMKKPDPPKSELLQSCVKPIIAPLAALDRLLLAVSGRATSARGVARRG
jgi:hypothetical protein